jgi:hypothetical protein
MGTAFLLSGSSNWSFRDQKKFLLNEECLVLDKVFGSHLAGELRGGGVVAVPAGVYLDDLLVLKGHFEKRDEGATGCFRNRRPSLIVLIDFGIITVLESATTALVRSYIINVGL